MKIHRKFTQRDTDVFDIDWTTRSSRIANFNGSVVFEMKDAQVPSTWSQLATDIMVSKYFRKAGVPQRDESGNVSRDHLGHVVTGPERSARQVIDRMVGCWREWGQKHNYFDTPEDGQAFYDELCHMLLNQIAAPNSPQWFNTGLHYAYGIKGPAQGHWATDPHTGETKQTEDTYSHPQPHACFIQSINDDLVNPGGIMDLWVREARLFKYGSGTGTNFSTLRGEDEPLSGGGKSSGLMSWLRIGDRAAGAIKSGGTTRRAAKMVCLDLDHPDVESFVNWKMREELKVAAMVTGLKSMSEHQRELARATGLSLDYDFNGEAYQTISGQNSNNSVRIKNEFFKRLDEGGDWELIRRTDQKVAKSISAGSLWDQIARAAWHCADPGVQYDTTINQWHTCPESGRINASNPCSEYMFLDNTACNLMSLNLLKFYDAKTRTFDLASFEHAVSLWTIVLEISVLMAAYPSKEIAQLSYQYRTLGLGYANIGAMLMQAGIAYDSEEARAICGAITAIMTGRSYAMSAKLASHLGPFTGFFKNREHMLRVIRNHRLAAYGVSRDPEVASNHELGDYEGIEIRPVPIDASQMGASGGLSNKDQLLRHARAAWDDALMLGERHGYRNAQTTVIAPTGTIGLLMDCDTTGVEPDFALVKFKKLAGGGYFKIANQSIKPALQNLGYDEQQIKDILTYVMGSLHLDVPLPASDGVRSKDNGQEATTLADFLREKGFREDDLHEVLEVLPTVFELQQAFNPSLIDPHTLSRLGLSDRVRTDKWNLLLELGLSLDQIAALNTAICGTQTVEGAPHLKTEHLPVFDCAHTCGANGKRFISVDGHIQMMAAAQPFISGAISKTINLQNNATVEDIQRAYRISWELGLKANALYRDGCKLSQPLNTTSEDDGEEDEDDIEAAKEEVAAEVASMSDRITGENDAVKLEKVIEQIIERPMRRRLPDTRRSITHKFNVAGHEGYLTVGLYEEGTPGELFITMAKEGSTIGGLMDSLGTAISVALQYGVPIESLVNKFTHQRFEPAGMTHNADIPFAKSLVDYIFRWMGMEFIYGYRTANAPARSSDKVMADGKLDDPATATVSTDRNNKQPPSGQLNRGFVGPEPSTPSNGNDRNQERGRNYQLTGSPRSQSASVTVTGPIAAREKSKSAEEPSDKPADAVDPTELALATAMKEIQADAPACDVCGTITVRSGTCYKCLNCGNAMGCS